MSEERSSRKTRAGIVASAKMSKTVSVTLTRLVRHPLYEKVMRRRKNVLAHDELGACKAGDRVLIAETRPISSRKRWRVIKILESGAGKVPAAEASQ